MILSGVKYIFWIGFKYSYVIKITFIFFVIAKTMVWYTYTCTQQSGKRWNICHQSSPTVSSITFVIYICRNFNYQMFVHAAIAWILMHNRGNQIYIVWIITLTKFTYTLIRRKPLWHRPLVPDERDSSTPIVSCVPFLNVCTERYILYWKSRRIGTSVNSYPNPLKFDRHLGSNAAKSPAKFPSYEISMHICRFPTCPEKGFNSSVKIGPGVGWWSSVR